MIPECGASLVAALQSGMGMAVAAVSVWGGVFSVWALAMVLLCHQKCLRCHRTAWMGSALAWLVFTALRPRECCFWSFLTHISASSLFASLFPSSRGRLSTGTENFTS